MQFDAHPTLPAAFVMAFAVPGVLIALAVGLRFLFDRKFMRSYRQPFKPLSKAQRRRITLMAQSVRRAA